MEPSKPQSGRPFGLLLLGLSVLGIVALSLVITALVGVVATLIDAALFGWSASLEHIRAILTERSSLLRVTLVALIVSDGVIVAATLLFARWRGGAAWRDLIAWHGPRVELTDRWIWTIVIAVAIYGFGAAFVFDERTRFFAELAAERKTAALVVLVFLVVVVVAPVTEELLFRGWIYTGLRHRLGIWLALIISSAIFALAHYDGKHIILALTIFPVGMAFGALRERTGTIKASIAFHASWNLVAMALVLIE